MEKLLNTFSFNFSINNFIDILIIAFLVYNILGFIRNTRAEQLARGVLFLLFAYAVAHVCRLYAIEWILERIMNVGLIAFVVVFQPELRRALESLGRGKFTSKTFSSSLELVSSRVEVILRSLEYFADRREGALIVIERQTALLDVAETGTILDAKLSEEALENVFYKGSPLHDGACILRADRIFAAGCVLPLTTNTALSKDLGTRHRAGIGISEVSDAVVLIVSEETGIISMAVDGKLSRFLDLKTVEKYLYNMYTNALDEDRSVWERLTENLKGKRNGKE